MSKASVWGASGRVHDVAGSGAMAVVIGVGFKRDVDFGSVVRDGGFFVVQSQDPLT